MGEARQRRDYKRELLARFPWCIYCGGDVPAEDVDHVPSKMMFRNKHRPKGLEVPSCVLCNRNSSKFEVIANAFGRIGFGEAPQIDSTEFGMLLRDAEANNAGFLSELNPQRHQLDEVRRLGLPEGSGAFSVRGPIVAGAINRFAAKLGFALHWIETGRVVPHTGGVMTRWFTNHSKLSGRFPDKLMTVLGEKKTLSQGRFSVGDRFGYSCAVADTRRMGLYFSAFQFAFATLSYVHEDLGEALKLPGDYVFRPKFIRTGAELNQIPEFDTDEETQ